LGSETELAMFVLGLGVGVVAIIRSRRLRRLERWPLLATAYALLLLGWAATTIEGVFAPVLFNEIEHTAYAASAIVAAIWCAVRAVPRQERPPVS
jgi:hypothetical protein